MHRLGRVRIIAGNWKSRQVRVPPGVRPTQDILRETIFNILGKLDPASRCLDLYAGSGCLGLEALSRGAATVTFVDHSTMVHKILLATIVELDVQRQSKLVHQDVTRWLKHCPQKKYDLVFADPPYTTSKKPRWWAELLQLLQQHLVCSAKIYLEGPVHIQISQGWRCLRQGQAGAAHWCVLERDS